MFYSGNWYWFVAGDESKVYSSKTNIYVPATDGEYMAWAAAMDDHLPSRVLNEAEIWPYVSAGPPFYPAWLFDGATFVQPTPTTYTHAQLLAYSAVARFTHASGGITIQSLSPALFNSDPLSRNTVNSAYDYSLTQTGSWSLQWKMSDGTFIPLDKTKVTLLMNDMSSFVQACFTKESTLVTGINTDSVTDLAAIDSAYATISNVFP